MFKYILHRTIFIIPPIMLLASLLSSLVSLDVTFLGDVLGYSILANLVFLHVFFYTGKYCTFTKLSVLGLLAMNLINILTIVIPFFIYSYIYDIIIVAIVIFLGIILAINRK